MLKVQNPDKTAKPKKEKIDIRERKHELNNAREDSVTNLRDFVVTGSRNNTFNMKSHHIGALNLSRSLIAKTPTVFGESDIIKTLQLEPGVSAGVEGFAGLYVHGGNADENQYTLDGVPLYQVNHLAGLFSAFNTESIKSADFYKTTFPAHLDGKLSSYIDIFTRDGSTKGYHGSLKLGLTSGAFNIEGPLYKDKTTFTFGMRRSWFDLITIPACKLMIKMAELDATDANFGYAFTDMNMKVTHRLSPASKLWFSTYWGYDYFNFGQSTKMQNISSESDINLYWGNFLLSGGWEKEFSPTLRGNLIASATRYRSQIDISDMSESRDGDKILEKYLYSTGTNNYIYDYRLNGTFTWTPTDNNQMMYGAIATAHDFMPMTSFLIREDRIQKQNFRDNVPHLYGGEVNIFAEDNWHFSDRLLLSGGLHYTIFKMTGKENGFKQALSPRLSFNYTPNEEWALKGGYSRTSQFIYQLSQSLISLPTDQWLPIGGGQKPMTADKIALGAYWTHQGLFTVSLETYMKWIHNVLEFRDEHYLVPPTDRWTSRSVAGSGTAKGVDFKFAREFGAVSGQLSYSLLWADRLFTEKNNGERFPARFDNRHKINAFINWRLTKRFDIGVSWTGMSGNRITLPTQIWNVPFLGAGYGDVEAELRTQVNNYRLPFYHRMDLSATLNTKSGFWNLSVYNAYCYSNAIAVARTERLVEVPNPGFDPNTPYTQPTTISSQPTFVSYRLFPIIPTISYTWLF